MYAEQYLEELTMEKIEVGGTDYVPLSKVKEKFSALSGFVVWTVEDFKTVAEQLMGDGWPEYFDESKFATALDAMIHHHDAEIGINWSVVETFLCKYCKKPFDNRKNG